MPDTGPRYPCCKKCGEPMVNSEVLTVSKKYRGLWDGLCLRCAKVADEKPAEIKESKSS